MLSREQVNFKGRKIAYFLVFITSLFACSYAIGYDQDGVEEFLDSQEKEQIEDITKGFEHSCIDVKESDYPTIFVPGIGASWYSEYGFEDKKVRRWMPDPISHVYDTLFFTFKQNGYTIEDVFYDDEFTLKIDGNPKHALYLFGYDWKKDNKITATLLAQLVGLILKKYEQENGCNIGKVNIVSHSMGGLVARSLLEDMCVEMDSTRGTFEVKDYYTYDENNDIKSVDGQLKKLETISCHNPIDVSVPIRVNSLITIATPHRGSPKSFSVWEKGDLGKTDDITFELGIKNQLQGIKFSDNSLFKALHGYDENIPNGIIGLGQLLPDIGKETEYNKKLLYLKQGDMTFDAKNHPQNSFLESLNETGNINKMWDKIDKDYISYYSLLTGTNFTSLTGDGKNNVVGFEISKSYGGPEHSKPDTTSTQEGRDIFSVYPSFPAVNYYNIQDTIQKENGTGGDGTVPSLNLRLVPNDSTSGEEIQNPKFRSEEIKCYNPTTMGFTQNWSIDGNNEDSIIDSVAKKYESEISREIGSDASLQMCSHTIMPIASVIKVYEQVSGEDIHSSPYILLNDLKERTKMLEYLGHSSYLINQTDEEGDSFDIGISNNSQADWFFKQSNYIKAPTATTPISLSFGNMLHSTFRYDILSPINILITDENGNKIGIDPDTGHIINEIPGAWTSGDTEGSGEPEFFLIPHTGTGNIDHTIETFGTGDGEYHIQMSEVDDENPALIIAGNAKQGFSEEYEIVGNKTPPNLPLSGEEQNAPPDKGEAGKAGGFTYTKTSNYPAVIETQRESYTTWDDTFTLRYSVKGNSENVGRVLVEVIDVNGEKKSSIVDIDGATDILLGDIGIYTVTLTLLDTQDMPLTYAGAQKAIALKKIANWLQAEDSSDGKKPKSLFNFDFSAMNFSIFQFQK